jgi:hypothetical protein
MELTVRKLKEIINDLDDDVILATLQMGNDDFKPFSNVKRVLMLKDVSWGGSVYLTINSMGSHFTATGKQEGLKIIKTFE